MQETSTRVGGHFLSTSCVIRSLDLPVMHCIGTQPCRFVTILYYRIELPTHRSSILALTNSGSTFSSTADPDPEPYKNLCRLATSVRVKLCL